MANKNWRSTFERVEKFISDTYFTDINLHGRLYGERQPVTEIYTSGKTDRIAYEKAINLEYKPTQVGQAFGPTWATHWFRIHIDIPERWLRKEIRLIWDSDSEAMVWQDGIPVQGLNKGDRTDFIITKDLEKHSLRYILYIEMACNTMFGAGDQFIGPPKPDRQFTLSTCDIAVFNRRVYNLIRDFEILLSIAKNLPEESPRKYQALQTANSMVNESSAHGSNGYAAARTLAHDFLNQHNGDSQLTVHAMGHAHIDSAWLWQYDETKRKCARSWASTIRLMESYPEYKFVCSQAQQYEWVKETYPELYRRICVLVQEGRFIPVGGTWVEMDGNLPSGEAFVRQFLYGQRFFQKEFGIRCKEFWLPDTFGYSSQLPQIMRDAGIQRFVTQKLSWSLINKFPHHTFWWEGIDGSRCLVHFPPADSYSTSATTEDVIKSISNLKDKGRTNHTLLLFGLGDGGGGPTEDMLERLDRLKDVDGIPRVSQTTPDEFFSAVEKESSNLCRWIGELYLELHQGTFTTQAMIKKYNRKIEFLLHNVELIYAILVARKSAPYPTDQLDNMWKKFLLNQFHDVLPGSCIELVVQDALKLYRDVEGQANTLLQEGMEIFLSQFESDEEKKCVVFNAHSWTRTEVVTLPVQMSEVKPPKNKRLKTDICTAITHTGETVALVEVPPIGYSLLQSPQFKPCTIKIVGDLIIMDNEILTAHIDRSGRIRRLIHVGRNAIREDEQGGFYGNQFVLFDDVPLFWDAWDVMDYHLETRSPLTNITSEVKITDQSSLRCAVSYVVSISQRSWIRQDIVLDAASPSLVFKTQVEWHESHKLLKVEFPINVRTLNATYEIQFGHIQRPTHGNTSWDWARYEVVGHKWADMSEYDFGVSVLNDSKYGFSAKDNVLSMSLLRSSKSPDANADMGQHQFSYAILPHKGTLQEAGVIQAAYDFNNPLILTTSTVSLHDLPLMPFFEVTNPAIILETIKKAEDMDDALVIRLYEAFGGQADGVLKTRLPVKQVTRCNILEEAVTTETCHLTFEDGNIHLHFQPFQIMSFILSL